MVSEGGRREEGGRRKEERGKREEGRRGRGGRGGRRERRERSGEEGGRIGERVGIGKAKREKGGKTRRPTFLQEQYKLELGEQVQEIFFTDSEEPGTSGPGLSTSNSPNEKNKTNETNETNETKPGNMHSIRVIHVLPKR
jgi:hypothetical protein